MDPGALVHSLFGQTLLCIDPKREDISHFLMLTLMMGPHSKETHISLYSESL